MQEVRSARLAAGLARFRPKDTDLQDVDAVLGAVIEAAVGGSYGVLPPSAPIVLGRREAGESPARPPPR